MRSKVNPIVGIVVAVLVFAGVGLVAWKMFDSGQHEQQVVVKPANPDDPKYKPHLKPGMMGVGGGANSGGTGD